jgi:hypothetical protein
MKILDNLPLHLAKTASEFPNKTAINFEDYSITCGDLNERVSKVVQILNEYKPARPAIDSLYLYHQSLSVNFRCRVNVCSRRKQVRL